MKKILVIGSSGAGKSSFAKRLHKKIGLPLIHLDTYYWKPGWIKPETSEWEDTVRKLVSQESWIMDGNYRSTLHLRFPAADTIILIDLPFLLCLYRVLKRQLTKQRVDAMSGREERISWNHFWWVVWKYPHVARKDMLQRLLLLPKEKTLIILPSRKKVENFLENVTETNRQIQG